MPPEKDLVSDEDSEDEEGVLDKDPNHLGRKTLTMPAELEFNDPEDELPDVEVMDENGDVVEVVVDETEPRPKRGCTRSRGGPAAKKSRKQEQQQEEENVDEEEEEEVEEIEQLRRTKNTDRKWMNKKPRSFGRSLPDFVVQPLKQLPDNCTTPYDFHQLFVDDNFIDEMVRTSTLYANRKNRQEEAKKITRDTIRTSMAIMYMTGYLTPSNRNMYWELKEDTSNTFVRKAMSKKTFVAIIRNSYFVESVVPDPKDKFWKVRPLFDQLNRAAKTYMRQSREVSVDEAMVKYFGPHPLKQYMKGKPCRFGYKVGFCIVKIFNQTFLKGQYHEIFECWFFLSHSYSSYFIT